MNQNAYQPPTRFSVFPPVIKNLLIINGLVFLAQMVPSTNMMLVRFFALWPMGEGLFYPWQLVTYGFLHSTSGFGHILFNMFALWMFGVRIENAWGTRRFAIYYFVCVIGAGIAQLIVATLDPMTYPTVGASGGVFGVLLAFGMMYPDEPIYLYFLFPIKAKWLVIGMGVFELFSGISGAQSGVANFAHLGGMVIGIFLILYWRGKLPIQPEHKMYW